MVLQKHKVASPVLSGKMAPLGPSIQIRLEQILEKRRLQNAFQSIFAQNKTALDTGFITVVDAGDV